MPLEETSRTLAEGAHGKETSTRSSQRAVALMKGLAEGAHRNSRRRRKEMILIETLRQAREKVPAQDVEVALRPAGAAAVPPTLKLCMRDTPTEQERDLLAITFISEEDRRDLGVARVFRGFVVQPPIAGALAVAQRVGAIAGAQMDRDMVKIGDHFLRKETIPLASKRLVCDLSGRGSSQCWTRPC